MPKNTDKIKEIKKGYRAFSSNAESKKIWDDNKNVDSFLHISEDEQEKIIEMQNLTDETQHIRVDLVDIDIQEESELKDLLTEEIIKLDSNKRLTLYLSGKETKILKLITHNS